MPSWLIAFDLMFFQLDNFVVNDFAFKRLKQPRSATLHKEDTKKTIKQLNIYNIYMILSSFNFVPSWLIAFDLMFFQL